LFLLVELIQLVLHVRKVGELVIEMAIEKLDPKHKLALLVPRNQVVEKL
jgi:hypothetical protein